MSVTTDRENAIHAWVVAASGYPATSVFWDGPNVPRPEVDFITLAFGDAAALGCYDATIEETDLGRPAGQEVERRVEGWRESPLTLQAFTKATNGDTAARAVLMAVLLRLNFLSVNQALTAVGLAAFDLGTVQSLPLELGSKFTGRAMLEVRFYHVDTASEFTGYIDEVAPPAGEFAGAVIADISP